MSRLFRYDFHLCLSLMLYFLGLSLLLPGKFLTVVSIPGRKPGEKVLKSQLLQHQPCKLSGISHCERNEQGASCFSALCWEIPGLHPSSSFLCRGIQLFFPHCLFDARLTGNLQIRISTRVGSAPSLPPFLAAAKFQTENVGSSCDDAEDGCWGVSQACSVHAP